MNDYITLRNDYITLRNYYIRHHLMNDYITLRNGWSWTEGELIVNTGRVGNLFFQSWFWREPLLVLKRINSKHLKGRFAVCVSQSVNLIWARRAHCTRVKSILKVWTLFVAKVWGGGQKSSVWWEIGFSTCDQREQGLGRYVSQSVNLIRARRAAGRKDPSIFPTAISVSRGWAGAKPQDGSESIVVHCPRKWSHAVFCRLLPC